MSEDNRKPNRIMVNSRIANHYTLRLARAITEIDDFEEEFQLFAGATEYDVIHADIITPGGSVDTAHMLCRAIAMCPAHTVAYIGPTCASSGTAIALAFEEWEIDEMSSFMIHTASYGAVGMAPHVKAHVDHNDLMVEKFVRNTYTGFLTEEEILKVLEGKEIYFEGDGLADRLGKFSDYRQKRRESHKNQEVAEDLLDSSPNTL